MLGGGRHWAAAVVLLGVQQEAATAVVPQPSSACSGRSGRAAARGGQARGVVSTQLPWMDFVL
jgi:hypothetical protein